MDLQPSKGDATVKASMFSVEVITLPVSDVERALRFYVDQVGFTLDVDRDLIPELADGSPRRSRSAGFGQSDMPARGTFT
jgi:catechol 2,3-dioxygenase-like lactoylglutathione lyase family enzyme